MLRLVLSAILFISTIIICACGSNNGSGTTASGNTVTVSSGITPNTSGSVFGNISSNFFTASPISITLTSVAKNPSSSIPTSPVSVKSINMTLVPLAYASQPPNITGALSPTISVPQYSTIVHGIGGVIPGPGSLKIDGIDLLGVSDGLIMWNHYVATGFATIQYKYTATLHFHCIESNSKAEFTVSNPVGIQVDMP